MTSLEKGPDERSVKDIVSVPRGGFGSMGTRWKKMMKKYTKSTPCLCSAPPRAFTNHGHGEMKAPVPRQHRPGGEPLPGFLAAFLSQPLVLIHFPLTFSTASLGFFFCTLLRLLFYLSPMTSKILAKSCCDLFCDFWRRVWCVVGILQKQPCAFQLLLSW